MVKKFVSLTTLIAFIFSISRCSTAGLQTSGTEVQTEPDREYVSKIMPQVFITTSTMKLEKVKLVSLQDKTLSVLPYPYSGPGLMKINLDDIHGISLSKTKKVVGWTTLGGLLAGGLIATLFGGLAAGDKNTELWPVAYLITCPIGLLAGAIIGIIIDVSKKSNFDFNFKGLSIYEKKRILKKIMLRDSY